MAPKKASQEKKSKKFGKEIWEKTQKRRFRKEAQGRPFLNNSRKIMQKSLKNWSGTDERKRLVKMGKSRGPLGPRTPQTLMGGIGTFWEIWKKKNFGIKWEKD